MSYTLAFFTVPLDELTARLAPQAASSTPESVAQQCVDLLRELGRPVDAVSHSSAGGAWFREHFIYEFLAGLIGAETAGHLVDRPLAGAKWSSYPSMGWLTRHELAAAMSALAEAGDDALAPLDDPESEELFELIDEILHMAAETGLDLVTVYS